MHPSQYRRLLQPVIYAVYDTRKKKLKILVSGQLPLDEIQGYPTSCLAYISKYTKGNVLLCFTNKGGQKAPVGAVKLKTDEGEN